MPGKLTNFYFLKMNQNSKSKKISNSKIKKKNIQEIIKFQNYNIVFFYSKILKFQDSKKLWEFDF